MMGLPSGSEMMGVCRSQGSGWEKTGGVGTGLWGQVWAARLRGRGCGGLGGFVWEVVSFSVFVM